MKSIELFAGIGGIALAAEWAGIETVAFCEREPYCQKLLNQNFPNVPVFDDVRTLNRQLLEDKGVIEPNGTIDIISGGFPCQPYSSAGKRRGTEDDRDLWPEMFRIIKELRPTWVVGENVANFANMELDRTLLDLESTGYKVQSFIIPACAVDAKHRRDRTFVVSYSDSFVRMEHKRQSEKIQQSKQQELQRKESCDSIVSEPSHSYNETLADSESKRCGEEGEHKSIRQEKWTSCSCTTFSDKENQGDVRRHWVISDNDRSSGTRSYHRRGTETDDVGQRWPAEPDVGRVAHGVPNRVDRIKGLGNAVVPQQIYPIFKAIVDISNRA
ncbi:DNA cytosine methyltransferase [Bacillus pumilus]|uniref:DNA cytosine methyltransferase n=1 Tax=Bacillus pumilus TaxID=1408 RepID=UPI00017A643D|nr:DNA (cytosine-5-)-methyltransferase [Bacillus pumilus]EDW20667.1 site-specific DNA-methyltransferase [Bacillus pumilus ATCC 7061]MCR4353415.1 DNA cytosine methyltransferase [Bacillus pumilus]MCY7505149.1 DNA cytosine methyltransferase [Bacillus pumilus]MDR4269484.1 DNA cytosine methyltransferase [Bacillus pumilus]MED4725707.1 DNA (cytosine-5-)-methyltransferase [Bacillus pumilus]